MAAARRQSVPIDLETWEEGLPESFLMCRDMGHTWKPHTAAWEAEENAYRRVLKCPRCRTLRTQWISPSGHLDGGSHYTYPDGYTAPAGVGRIDGGGRDHLRLLSVLRTVDKAANNVRPIRRAG